MQIPDTCIDTLCDKNCCVRKTLRVLGLSVLGLSVGGLSVLGLSVGGLSVLGLSVGGLSGKRLSVLGLSVLSGCVKRDSGRYMFA